MFGIINNFSQVRNSILNNFSKYQLYLWQIILCWTWIVGRYGSPNLFVCMNNNCPLFYPRTFFWTKYIYLITKLSTLTYNNQQIVHLVLIDHHIEKLLPFTAIHGGWGSPPPFKKWERTLHYLFSIAPICFGFFFSWNLVLFVIWTFSLWNLVPNIFPFH
jgi:hypothetical protein